MSYVCRDFVRAEDLPEPPRKIARSVVKKKETALGSTSGPPLKKRGVQSPKIDSKACVTTEISPAIKEEVNDEIPYTENVPLEDLVHMVKDERTVGTAIVKDEPIGGIESNTAGGVRTRVVMRRDSDGRAAQIVENIRQQMRSAAGYGASDDYGKVAVSDDRFFAAYKVMANSLYFVNFLIQNSNVRHETSLKEMLTSRCSPFRLPWFATMRKVRV